MKRYTIQDVAKESGVSITTVSRVINKNYPVKEATRVKVEAVIKKLNFKPNLLAKGLIQSVTKTIGILTPSIENLFFSEVIKGIDSVMRPLGYTSFLCNTEGESEKEVDMINSLIDRQVDGIIVLDPRKANFETGFFNNISGRVNLLLVNGYYADSGCDNILNDSEGGTLAALNYLKDSGCSQIAFLRGGKSFSYDEKERHYLKYSEDNGLKEFIISIKDGNDQRSVDYAREAVIKSLKSGKAPDGILCCNDWMAVGALNAAKSLGLKIPEEIRIVGFDNTIISQITEPKLTTVDQQMSRLGEMAAERIDKMMNTDDCENQKIYLETKLIVRES